MTYSNESVLAASRAAIAIHTGKRPSDFPQGAVLTRDGKCYTVKHSPYTMRLQVTDDSIEYHRDEITYTP